MSISTGPISAADGMQHKTVQPAAAGSAQVFNAPLTRVQAEAAEKLAAVADIKNADAAKISSDQTRQSLQDINQVLTSLSISVQFQIDPNYKDVIVRVVDQESGKLIRQIPSEDVVRISKAMDNLKGLLFAQSV